MARIKGIHFEKEIVELCTTWYQERQLSSRKIEVMMRERGLTIDHATINRWVKKFLAVEIKSEVSSDDPSPAQWTMQESYVKIRGQWRYLYVFFNQLDEVIDFYVNTERNRSLAFSFYLQNHPEEVATGSTEMPQRLPLDHQTGTV
jgi:putative transposase